MAALGSLDLITALREIDWRMNHLTASSNHPRPGEAICALKHENLPPEEIRGALENTDIRPERQTLILRMLSGRTASLEERTALLRKQGLLLN